MAKTVTMKQPKPALATRDAFVLAGGRTSGATEAPLEAAPKVRITVDLPKADHRAFRVAASHEGRGMGDIIRQLVAEWMERR